MTEITCETLYHAYCLRDVRPSGSAAWFATRAPDAVNTACRSACCLFCIVPAITLLAYYAPLSAVGAVLAPALGVHGHTYIPAGRRSLRKLAAYCGRREHGPFCRCCAPRSNQTPYRHVAERDMSAAPPTQLHPAGMERKAARTCYLLCLPHLFPPTCHVERLALLLTLCAVLDALRVVPAPAHPRLSAGAFSTPPCALL